MSTAGIRWEVGQNPMLLHFIGIWIMFLKKNSAVPEQN
jgi:hypothetical protein